MARRPSAFTALATLALPLAIAGCGGPEPDPAAVMTEASLAGHVRVLSSDAFEGRSPASHGEERTIRYLVERFRALGLRPGNHGSWTQDVPLVGISAAPGAALEVTGASVPLRFVNGLEAVMFSKRVATHVALERSEMVFVGYGVSAPEVGWDDFKGVDVRGKTLVMLVNDPDFAAPVPPTGGAAPVLPQGSAVPVPPTGDEGAAGAFGGKRMTYYGRWTYKYEEAARRGAAGVLLVHDTAAAGYDWDVVTGSWSGEQFDLASADGNAGRAAIEGWLRRDAAAALFAAAGQDLATLERAAQRRDFQPVALGLQASAALEQTVRNQASHNVVALLPGSERPDEHLVYMAHWDHLGVDPSLPGDRIFNGAVDNATGTGALLELAAAFAALEPRPARSIVFLAVTAEESGLLGSQHYASEPVFPLARTVAAINIDSMNIDGPTRDVTVIGRGASELEDVLERAARAQGRVLTDEPSPEKGYFYRSDHFNFAKRGVPVLYAEGGIDLVQGGPEAGRAASERYHREAYHKPADEMRTDWDLGGALQDLQLYFAIGRELATTDAWPGWREGNEFRAAREASRDQRR